MCNYCKLNYYKSVAKKEGKRIIVKPSNFMNGVIIFKIKKGKRLPRFIEPNWKYPDGDENYQKYRTLWLMEIGTYCSC